MAGSVLRVARCISRYLNVGTLVVHMMIPTGKSWDAGAHCCQLILTIEAKYMQG